MARRLKKTTRVQYQNLIIFVEKNRNVIIGKTRSTDCENINSLWQKFASEENARGNGPVKSAKQWRKIFNEWKVNTKRKSREISLGGHGQPSNKKLNLLEERLLQLISNPDNQSVQDSLEVEYEFSSTNLTQANIDARFLDVSGLGEITTNGDLFKSHSNDGIYIECKEEIEIDEFDETQIKASRIEDIIEIPKTTSGTSDATESIPPPSVDPSPRTEEIKSVGDLASSIKELAAAYRERTRIKFKFEYYKTFGNLDGYEDFCRVAK
ncbi:hypothetical protein RN001_015328 [Aquatica leii]|uniref:Regulatory protein zeste n=1 Tax=Aquatica leii TaxID=1421715 RepID=A0AAN7SD51_9COLE|nr:hypothetical protein RN001_015328 [Aquatica leii]